MFVIALPVGAVVEIKDRYSGCTDSSKMVMTNVIAVIGGKERGIDRFQTLLLLFRPQLLS